MLGDQTPFLRLLGALLSNAGWQQVSGRNVWRHEPTGLEARHFAGQKVQLVRNHETLGFPSSRLDAAKAPYHVATQIAEVVRTIEASRQVAPGAP